MFAGRAIDRVGVFEGFWNETLDRWVNEGFPTKVVHEKGMDVVKPEDPFRYFVYDLHKAGGFFDTDPHFGEEEILEETEQWVVIRNGAGAALKWWKHKSGTPEHVDFLMKDRRTWEAEYRPHLFDLNVARFNGKWWQPKTVEEDKIDLAMARERNQWAWFGHTFVWEIMRNALGDLRLYETLAVDPEWVRDICRVYMDFFKVHFDAYFKEMGLPDGMWIGDDLAYKNGLFASPAMLEATIMPYYEELNEYFKSYGLPVIFHSDGNVSKAIPLLLEVGFQGLTPCESFSGMDIFDLAERYGDRMVIFGGLSTFVLETNDRQAIKKEVTRIVEGMKARNAKYVFGSDHAITPNVSFDSYRCALDTYRETMMF